ncbi:hypothetical protein Scep_010290 [Stephania cephalantha]|uniref:ASCH domain-containing protein n=1 Tax=Stephania cephalantha TaxID=152367 RepID=A0AAP0JVG6_9MAGN
MGSRGYGNLRNPCLTMHQPWASLLVYGIKRIEGRSWPSPIRGRLWIHAASKVPDPETIKAMEDFYREIYSVNGITDLKFPEHYPVSRLLGCVEVVGCIRCDELACWEEVPEGVRLEGQTDFCWLCEKPQKLVIPMEMRGYQGVYNLERKLFDAAVRGLCHVDSPLLVRFPLPDPRDRFSLKPGSLIAQSSRTKVSEVEKPPSLSAAIAGARAAATQFSKKESTHQNNRDQGRDASTSSVGREPHNRFTQLDARSLKGSDKTAQNGFLVPCSNQQQNQLDSAVHSNRGIGGTTHRGLNQQSQPPSKVK